MVSVFKIHLVALAPAVGKFLRGPGEVTLTSYLKESQKGHVMSLDEQFQKAKEKINSLPAQDNENLLKMYSLYKQATVGDVSGKKPGMFDLVGKAKYDAWEALKGMTQDQAKQSYIKLVDDLAKA